MTKNRKTKQSARALSEQEQIRYPDALNQVSGSISIKCNVGVCDNRGMHGMQGRSDVMYCNLHRELNAAEQARSDVLVQSLEDAQYRSFHSSLNRLGFVVSRVRTSGSSAQHDYLIPEPSSVESVAVAWAHASLPGRYFLTVTSSDKRSAHKSTETREVDSFPEQPVGDSWKFDGSPSPSVILNNDGTWESLPGTSLAEDHEAIHISEQLSSILLDEFKAFTILTLRLPRTSWRMSMHLDALPSQIDTLLDAIKRVNRMERLEIQHKEVVDPVELYRWSLILGLRSISDPVV